MKNKLQVMIILGKYSLFGILLQITLLQVLLAGSSNAQNGKDISQVNLSISLKEKSLLHILDEIEHKTSFNFVYNEKNLSESHRSDKEFQSISLEDLLKVLSVDFQLRFKQINERISVKPLARNQYNQNIPEVIVQITVTGVVRDGEGNPLPGASIRLEGSATGTVTDLDGSFSIQVPDTGAVLIVSFIGFETQRVQVGNQTEFAITLAEDASSLEEFVVTGVAGSVAKEKLGFTIEKLGPEILQQVPGVNAANSIRGKAAGVRVSYPSGAPGASPEIQLRGATAIFGSSNPLIIVDGVLTEGNLQDINAEDIENIEILKGAAASSLYGSRAANGVVSIITKRGSSLASGGNEITYRTEVGQSFIGFAPPKSESTNFEVQGNEVLYGNPRPDNVFGNPYPVVTDPVGQFFNPGSYLTNHIGFQSNSKDGNTALFSSVQSTRDAGVVDLTDGQRRINFRTNIDHHFNERLKFTANNFYSQSAIDMRANGIWDMFYYADPNVDFLQDNDDGTPYKVDPNRLGMHENPLYNISNTVNRQSRTRFLGFYGLNYQVLDFLELKAAYGVDRLSTENFSLTPKGKLNVNQPPSVGNIFRGQSNTMAQTFQADALLTSEWGKFKNRMNLQYLYESNEINSFNGSGTHLAVKGMDITNLNQASENLNINSFKTMIVANNISAMFYSDYDDKFIFDGLIRRDGVSLFGSEERWQTFFRTAGAYRITQDFDIRGIQELKVRTSYGTAGLRPPFEARYEVVGLANGQITNPITLGNENLRPSISRELEMGIDMRFLDRFTFMFNYARSLNTDQILNVPVSASTGFSSQWQNAGTLVAKVFEMSLGADLVNKPNFSWNLTVNADRVRQQVTALNTEPYSINAGLFRIEPGVNFGTIYGHKWATSLDEVANQVPAEASVTDHFVINNQGYVVSTGTIGTVDEIPIKVRDDNGNPIDTKIGDMNPDFTMNLLSNMRIHRVNLFALWSWQQGGDIYNHMRRYMLVHNVGRELDQFGKPANEIKAARYYNELTSWNNSHFVEDGTFVTLRELAVNYQLPPRLLDNFFLKNVSVGLVGRNLLMFTRYSGFNPETGHTEGGVDSNVFKFDISSYPLFRTFSGTVTVTF
ncbi:SusC/RagA family TonB-linked outer membrane protein [Negadavirga shengliensis]|uniref:SusC/RagA family TonB-linked outer membrane protein n=1 Tax=Negadavirga shengliensis TaxID=1389218 RepID=A0ABV9T2T6_9BACT